MSHEQRAYQDAAIDAARDAIRAGKRTLLLVAPTGAGKSVLIKRVAMGAVPKGRKIAIFAHRRELIAQLVGHMRAAKLRVGPGQEVEVLSIQAVLAKRKMPHADIVVFDEAHHYVADEYGEIPKEYRRRGAVLIGVTATPERADGIGLGEIFEWLYVVAQRSELTRLGYLVPCDVFAPVAMPNKLAQEPVDAYRAHCPGRSCVVFAPHIKAAESFHAGFVAAGIEAGIVHGSLRPEVRDATLVRFLAGALRVLVNVNVLTEGFDFPALEVVMLARKLGSITMYDQSLGRVLRPSPGKTHGTLIDLAGNIALHGPPDEDRVYSLHGQAVTRAGRVPAGARFCRVCGVEIATDMVVCECGAAVSKLVVPTAEEIALERLRRDAEMAELPSDKRVSMLTNMYVKGLRAGWKRAAAEHRYKGMLKHFPPSDVRVVAWSRAQETVAKERGDAWLPTE